MSLYYHWRVFEKKLDFHFRNNRAYLSALSFLPVYRLVLFLLWTISRIVELIFDTILFYM